jgi:flagellar biosynthesis GTPase FlhF
MKKCEPWAVAAVYLMQSASGKEHYTDIVNYIVITGLTEVAEKGAATARNVTDRISQKVVDGRAVFKSDGNGYYSLGDEGSLLKNEDIQGVIQCLNEKNLKINLVNHEDKETKFLKDNEILKDEMLDDEDDKLTDGVRKLSEEGKRLSEEARKLSDETAKLTEENKKLRVKNRRLEQENQHLAAENENLHEMGKKLRQEKQQIEEKLQSIKQLC